MECIWKWIDWCAFTQLGGLSCFFFLVNLSGGELSLLEFTVGNHQNESMWTKRNSYRIDLFQIIRMQQEFYGRKYFNPLYIWKYIDKQTKQNKIVKLMWQLSFQLLSVSNPCIDKRVLFDFWAWRNWFHLMSFDWFESFVHW